MANRSATERRRIEDYHQGVTNWRKWGAYLSESAWGTVREYYSLQAAAWEYFPHNHARSKVFRLYEDGLADISDRHQYICFFIASWNERDPILIERLFGFSGPGGSYGEDVKDYYFLPG